MPVHSFRSMEQMIEKKCDKCGGILHRTNLAKRLFCRTCWEYKDNHKEYIKSIKGRKNKDDKSSRKVKRKHHREITLPGTPKFHW